MNHGAIRELSRGLTALFVVGLLGACGSSESVETTLADRDPEVVAAGAVLYEAECAECHGSDLRGTDKGPSHLSAVYEPGHHGDGAFQIAVLQGVRPHHWDFGQMPPVPLEDGDIDKIIAFVRDAQEREGFEPYPP